MEIDEKQLKTLVDAGKVGDPKLRVMDGGFNVSLSAEVVGVGPVTLHSKRGGVRVMGPQTGLRFAKEVLGVPEVTVVLTNERE